MTAKTAAIAMLMLALLAPAITIAPAQAQNPPRLAQCPTPYSEASLVSAATPEYPTSAQGLGQFTVLVQVSISTTGQVVGASIYKSSGNADADQAAIVAARNSTFQPRVNNCVAEAADYIFRAEFVPPMRAGTNACTTPNRSIKAVKPVMPELPSSLQGSAGSYQAVVDIKVDAQGNVVSATIAQSTGNADVDRAILTAAQKTTYLPPLENCKPVAGEAWFHAGFGPRPTAAPSPGN